MKYLNIVIATLFLSSAVAQTPIKIKQIESFDQINLKYDSTKNYIRLLSIPFEFKVIFNTNDSLWLSDAYNYANGRFKDNIWNGVPFKIKIGEQYVFQYPSTMYPQQPDTCYYWVLSGYFLNPDNNLQNSLSQYVKRMREEGVISLNVGTLSEFKKKHPKIVEEILKNDSIGFDIRQYPRKFIDFITFPVEY